MNLNKINEIGPYVNGINFIGLKFECKRIFYFSIEIFHVKIFNLYVNFLD